MKKIVAAFLMAICLNTVCVAQGKNSASSESDSSLAKTNRLLNLLAGTRLTQLDCSGLDMLFCSTFFDYLVEIGFKSSFLSGPPESPDVNMLSYCEIVKITPDYFAKDGKITEMTITFEFCNNEKIVFKTDRRVSVAGYSDEVKIGIKKALRQCLPFNKPAFIPEKMMVLERRSTNWKQDSLDKYLKKKSRNPMEGVYDEVVASDMPKKSRIKIAIVKNGPKYDILYLEGAKNANDWENYELKGTMTPTGSKNLFRVNWYMENKEQIIT